MEIVQERLEREFGMTVITTVPNVSYHAFSKKNPDEIILVNNPSDLPDPSSLDRVEEKNTLNASMQNGKTVVLQRWLRPGLAQTSTSR